MKMKTIQQNLTKFDKSSGILKAHLNPRSQKYSRIKCYNAMAVPFFCMEVKFGPSGKRTKKIDINQYEIFQKNSKEKGMKKFWKS
jgi:hypothetical protein